MKVEADKEYLTIKGMLGTSLELPDISSTERTWACSSFGTYPWVISAWLQSRLEERGAAGLKTH